MSITNVSGSGCAALPCTIASLASGANTTINVTTTITAAGAFDNSATATPAESDSNLANNTDSTGNGGTASSSSADVMIVKSGASHYAGVNLPFDFTLVVTNNRPVTATGVTVNDPLAAGFSLLLAHATQGSRKRTAT